jgi:senataxin
MEQAAIEPELPPVGTPVTVSCQLDPGRPHEFWNGSVIAMPQKGYTGFNVLLQATRPPHSGGTVLSLKEDVTADLTFGYVKPVSIWTAGAITDLIEGKIKVPKSSSPCRFTPSFFKELVLAQDPRALDNESEEGLPLDWRRTVEHLCNERNADQWQREAIFHFLTHKFTLVAGPPGTGKSTLVDIIMTLLEKFDNKFWCCTDSNAAVDVLAEKLVKRKGRQAEGFFRLQPTFRETFTPPLMLAQNPGMSQETAEKMLNIELDLPLSLEVKIRRRWDAYEDKKLGKPEFKAERELLEQLVDAAGRLTKPPTEEGDDEAIEEAHRKAEEEFGGALQKLQKGYIKKAKGIFSTTGGASGPLLRNSFRSDVIIIDDNSQAMEAVCILPIVKGIAAGRLKRVLIIGDPQQLPPTRLSRRNHAASNGEVSMMERLEAAGFPVVRLRVQYRMHPDISSCIIKKMYNTMTNGENTVAGRPADEQFRNFLTMLWTRTIAKKRNVNKFNPHQNAIIISPSAIKGARFGSEILPGSTSRHNVQTAMMVFQLCSWLVKHGKFKPNEIMVTSFYQDQVQLLIGLVADLGGIGCFTVDGSQGKEAPIHIIDCVILGQAADESMGFLSWDNRRWNVGVSRAKSGRILICSENFVVRNRKTGVWALTIMEAKSKAAILDDAMFHISMATADKTHFWDVVNKFKASAGKGKKTEAPRPKLPESQVNKIRISHAHNMINTLPGCSQDEATRYLAACDDDLNVAIDTWCGDNPLAFEDDDVEV